MTATWSELASSSESHTPNPSSDPPGGGFFFIHEIESGKSVRFPRVFNHPTGSFKEFLQLDVQLPVSGPRGISVNQPAGAVIKQHLRNLRIFDLLQEPAVAIESRRGGRHNEKEFGGIFTR